MKAYLFTFLVGGIVGAGALFLILNRTAPTESTIVKQERGEKLQIVSSELKKGIKHTLTTKLYSTPTGEVTITQTLPIDTGWYLRLGIMPNYGNSFGLGALVGVEYRKGRMGYFLDTFYDPLLKQGGAIIGVSMKVW